MKRLLLLLLLLFVLACTEEPATTMTSAEPITTTTASTAAPNTTAPAASTVDGPKLTPVDEGKSDAAFAKYRSDLLAAVKLRDANAVVALSDPKIRTSFGGGGGSEDLRNALQQPGVWEDLESLLMQGGAFRGEGESRSFWAPYVYSNWPEDRDAFASFAITSENVPLYESPDANARVLATLSFDIVERAGQPSEDVGEWRHVKTANGLTGYVAARHTRSPVGYRAGFMRGVEGEWRMNALVAGD